MKVLILHDEDGNIESVSIPAGMAFRLKNGSARMRWPASGLAIWMATGKDAVLDDVNNLRWLRDRWRVTASASCYRTVVIYLDVPRTELIARRRANQVTVKRKAITDAVWAKHLDEFEPLGADEHVLRYGLVDDAASWITKHFDHLDGSNAES